MYAVIQAGGHQHKVRKGDVLSLNRLEGKEGEPVDFKQVLSVTKQDNKLLLGQPFVKACVKAEIVAHQRGPKVLVFKKKRRKGYKRTKGHRQELTLVKINEIVVQ